MTTYTSILALWHYSSRLPLPRNCTLAVTALMVVGTGQVLMGIGTLMFMVPIPLAAAHQAGSLILLSTGLWLRHGTKFLSLSILPRFIGRTFSLQRQVLIPSPFFSHSFNFSEGLRWMKINKVKKLL